MCCQTQHANRSHMSCVVYKDQKAFPQSRGSQCVHHYALHVRLCPAQCACMEITASHGWLMIRSTCYDPERVFPSCTYLSPSFWGSELVKHFQAREILHKLQSVQLIKRASETVITTFHNTKPQYCALTCRATQSMQCAEPQYCAVFLYTVQILKGLCRLVAVTGREPLAIFRY